MQDMVEPEMNANDGTGVEAFDMQGFDADTSRKAAKGMDAAPAASPKGRNRRRR